MSDIYKTIVLGGLNALIFLAQWYWAKYTEVSFVYVSDGTSDRKRLDGVTIIS